jgi:prepilin-type N-terminal cleavage/methylation domain-containing protein
MRTTDTRAHYTVIVNPRDKGTGSSIAEACGRRSKRPATKQRGFSLIEVMVVTVIVAIVAGFAIPNVMQAIYNARLRSSAGTLSDLMQQARSLAAKNNATYAIQFGTRNGAPIAFVDLNGNGAYDVNEPLAELAGTVTPAPGAPSGSGGQPSAYILAGDSGNGSYDNTNTMAFTPRGLPCNYDTSTIPPTCTTPAAKYFSYYLTDTRPIGPPAWAAVIVTKSGRSKVVMSRGGAHWN